MVAGEFRAFARSKEQLHEFGLTIDHLGLVAGMCDELEIIRIIEQKLDNSHPNMIISSGQACMAIILNLLNVLQQPLMLAPEFMELRPVDRLISRSDHEDIIGEHEITSEQFNQYVLGRTLDRLYKHGLEDLFMTIAGYAYQKFQHFTSRFLHIDTTTKSVHGTYDNTDDELIELTYGFSKDGNHGLKQFLISLICCDRIPIFISTMSGNKTDNVYFRELVLEYGQQIKDQFGEDKIFVFDTAFMNEVNMENVGNEIDWISRVPFTIGEAQALRDDPTIEFQSCLHEKLEDYDIWSKDMTYGRVEQRWIVVFSEGKYERDKKRLYKKIDEDEEARASSHSLKNKLQRKEFDNKEDAIQAVEVYDSQLLYHQVSSYDFTEKKKRIDGKRGRIGKNTPYKLVFQVRLKVIRDSERIDQKLETAGRFIVATNLPVTELSDENILVAYKDQQKVERGFRFLKDPYFFARSIFLEKPERISALAMLMGISLLVYNLCELKLRAALERTDQVFQDPYLKQTANPTIRRVFKTFQGIYVSYTTWNNKIIREKVINIKPWHIQVLELMGEPYMRRYEDGIIDQIRYIEALKSNLSNNNENEDR